MRIEYLKEKYSSYKNGSISDLYKTYVSKKEAALIDSITAALAINAIFQADKINFNAITPQMEKAFHLSFPNLELEHLTEMTESQLVGISQGWKGKLFELEVMDKLNLGENVGGIYLESGQYAELANISNQPGWDLQILNADGTVANELQLKATDSLGYINEAFAKYPDIDIISTSEVATQIGNQLIDSGITNEELMDSIIEPLSEVFDSSTEHILGTIFPGLPFLIITGMEGRKWIIGKQTYDQGFEKILERSIKTGVSLGVGSLAFFLTDMGIISIPATILTSLGIDAIKGMKDVSQLNEEMNMRNKELSNLLPYYS